MQRSSLCACVCVCSPSFSSHQTIPSQPTQNHPFVLYPSNSCPHSILQLMTLEEAFQHLLQSTPPPSNTHTCREKKQYKKRAGRMRKLRGVGRRAQTRPKKEAPKGRKEDEWCQGQYGGEKRKEEKQGGMCDVSLPVVPSL